MNGRSLLVLVMAMVCGLVAMLAVNQLFSKPSGTPKVDMVDVLVAARELKMEEVFTKADMVKVLKMPKETVPLGSFRSFDDVAERWVQIRTLPNEPILDAKLAPRDMPRGLLSKIPDGKRAFSIEVTEQSGVSGFVMPDHRVDVIQTRTSTRAGNAGLPVAETILQDVLVLASGQNIARTEDKAIMSRTVTLALSPEQVDTLVAAKTGGPLSLSMRSINDHEIVDKPVKEQPVEPPVEMVDVLVAARDLQSDEVLNKDLVRMARMPKPKVPPGSFLNVDDVAERWVRNRIEAGEPIVESRLAPADLVARIAPGTRAVAIEVNEQTGVAGFVLPGHRVDVVRQVQADKATTKGRNRPVAETVLQDVLVLASGQTFNRTEDKSVVSRTVTLQLTPEQVDRLVTCRSEGELSLSLRGREDHEVISKPAPEPTPLVVAPKVAGRVTIFHGSRGYERHTLFERAEAALAQEVADVRSRIPNGQ